MENYHTKIYPFAHFVIIKKQGCAKSTKGVQITIGVYKKTIGVCKLVLKWFIFAILNE